MCLAIPGRIEKIINDEPLFLSGLVDFSGVLREVNLSCLENPQVGEFVLVHAGVAIAKVECEEAGLREKLIHTATTGES